MNCNTCKKWIHRYLDGDLPPGSEEEIFRHVSICPDCEQYYEDLVDVFELMQEPEQDVPYGFSYAWREAVERTAQKKCKFNYRVLIPALAACVCGVFVMSFLLFGAGGYTPTYNHLNGNTFSLEYNEQAVQNNAQTPPSSPGNTEPGQTVQSGTGVQQPVTQGNDSATPDELLEEDAQGYTPAAESGMAAYGEMQDSGTTGDAPSSAYGEPAAHMQGLTPQIEERIENGKTIYVLDASELDILDADGMPITKEALLDYARQFNLEIDETDTGVLVEASPFVLELLLEYYNIEPIEGMDNLEIILQK